MYDVVRQPADRQRAATVPPLPMLLTGVTGVAGYNAFGYFHARYPGQVIAIRQQDNWRLSGAGIEPCDAEDGEGLRRLFDRFGFRSVLNCAGNCALKSCELDPAMAWRINVAGVENLLEAMHGHACRLLHLSVDLVFSGTRGGGHTEPDETDPVTEYGRTMVVGEDRVQTARPDACVLRISLPMGASLNGHAGAIDWIQSRFKQRKPATLYFDEVRTPTYTDCLNDLFAAVLASDLAGLYHAGGPRRLSLYEIAQIVNRVGGYDPHNLIGCPRRDAGPIPPRAGDVSLDSSKLSRALGYEPFDPWPLDERFVPDGDRWHFERDGDWAGSRELLADVLYRNPGRVADC